MYIYIYINNFDPTAVCVGFVLVIVGLSHVFLRVLGFPCKYCSLIGPYPNARVLPSTLYNLITSQHR